MTDWIVGNPLWDEFRELELQREADTVATLRAGVEGRLEIWMRASDLEAAKFDDVVSFWRMT